MSEPNSLFVKVHITKDNFDKFLKSKPTTPKLNNDWIEWWNSRKMYGKTELQEKDLYCYEDLTNESIINDWINIKETLSFSDYDVENEIWHFGIILFSENYGNMIPGLAFIKSVSEFKTECEEDFAIVYNFFWGEDDVCAYINYQNKEGLFDSKIQNKSDINLETMKYTEEYLDKKFKELTKDYES